MSLFGNIFNIGSGSGGGSEEYANSSSFPAVGQQQILYLAKDTGILYYWDINTLTYKQITGGNSVVDGQVVNYASLPTASNHNGEIWLVTTTTGIIYNRKIAGLYTSNGTIWNIITPINIDGYQTLINTPTNNNILTTDAFGQGKDSGKAFNDFGETSNDIWSAEKNRTELNLKQDSSKQTILQIGHGFTVGKTVRQNTNLSFSLAQSNSDANSKVCGLIIQVIDANSFVIAAGGSLSTLSYSALTSAIATQLGYGSWTSVPAGKTYYLSPTTAGNVTETKPTTSGQYVVPVFRRVLGSEDNIDILLSDPNAVTGSPSWGSITGTLSNQTDLQTALNGKEPTISSGNSTQYYRGDKTWQTLNKSAVGLASVDNTSDLNKPISTATQIALDKKVSNEFTETQIQALTPSSYINIPQIAKDTGITWYSNGSIWQNSNATQVKKQYIASTNPTTTNNASQGYSIGSTGLNTTTSNTFTLVRFNGTDAIWQNDSTTVTFADKTEFDTQRATGTYNGQVVIVTNANGINSVDQSSGSVITDGLSATILVVSATNYTITGRPTTSSTITVDKIITVSQNKSALTAGTYIATATFSDGMPLGIALNDIFTASGSGTYTLKSNFTNAPDTIRVGSGNNVTLYQRVANSWRPTSLSVIYDETISAGELVKINTANNRLKKIANTVAGTSTAIQSSTAVASVLAQTNPHFCIYHEIDVNKVVLITRQPSNSTGQYQIKIGTVTGSDITWGDSYTTTSSLFNATQSPFSVARVRDGYFAVLFGGHLSTNLRIGLFQYDNSSKVIAENVNYVPAGTSSVTSISINSAHMYGLGDDFVGIVASYWNGTNTTRYLGVIKFTSFNGASSISVGNAINLTSIAVDFDAANSSSYADMCKIYGETTSSNNVKMICMFSTNETWVRLLSITATYNNGTNTISFGSQSALATDSIGGTSYTLYRDVAPGPTALSVACLRNCSVGNSVGGFSTYLYIVFWDFSGGNPALITSYNAAVNSNPIPTVTNGPTAPTIVMSAALRQISSSATGKVYGIAHDLTNTYFGSTPLYLTTCSITTSPTPGFNGFANYGNIVSSTSYTGYYSAYLSRLTLKPLAVVNNVVTLCWSDATYSYSAVRRIYQYGSTIDVDYTSCIGIAQVSGVSGGVGSYLALGDTGYANPSANWTPGTKYYIQSNGTISSTQSPYYLGIATTNKEICLSNAINSSFVQSVVNPAGIVATNGSVSLSTVEPVSGIPDGRIYLLDSTRNVLGIIGADSLLRTLSTRKLITDTTNSISSITAGVGAGTSPTVSIDNIYTKGTDMSGVITITTGTTPTGSNAIISTITFGTAYPIAPKVVLTPANANASALSGATQVFVPVANDTNGVTSSAFKIVSGSSALSASTTYKFNYLITC